MCSQNFHLCVRFITRLNTFALAWAREHATHGCPERACIYTYTYMYYLYRYVYIICICICMYKYICMCMCNLFYALLCYTVHIAVWVFNDLFTLFNFIKLIQFSFTHRYLSLAKLNTFSVTCKKPEKIIDLIKASFNSSCKWTLKGDHEKIKTN